MQSSHIRAVIFDYGGVLVQTRQQEPRAVWERQLGMAPGTLTRLVHDAQVWVDAQRGVITTEAHWQTVGTTLGLTATDLTALRSAFYRGDVLNTDLLAYVEHLRHAGIRLGLLSNFSTDLRTMLGQQDLLWRFDHIAISAEIGIMKPAAAAYETILAMLELEAPACVFVDDLPTNVAAAQALGLHGIVFRDTVSCLAELERVLAGSAGERRRV
jgi:putative hydrolase of the HAD superfamily